MVIFHLQDKYIRNIERALIIFAAMVHTRHILICRNDALGDAILALPSCGIIKKYYPNVEISFLGRTYTKDVVTMSENVDHFINYDEIVHLDNAQLQNFFKERKIDTAILLRNEEHLAQFIKRSKIKYRIGNIHSVHHLFTCNRWVSFSRSKSRLNECQLDIKLLRSIGIKEVPTLEEIPQYYGLKKIPTLLPETYENLIVAKKFNLILHPLTTGNGPEWGLDNFSQLLQILDLEKFNVIIGGSKGDLAKMDDFLEANKGMYHRVSGSLALDQYISLINECDGLIAGSTGPVHVSAAIGKYTLGLYTDILTKNAERWGPVGKHVFTLEGKNNDMNTILPNQVIDILNGWLSEKTK